MNRYMIVAFGESSIFLLFVILGGFDHGIPIRQPFIRTALPFLIHVRKIWYSEMENNPSFSNQSNLNQVLLMTSYLEIMHSIMENGLKKSFFMIMKYPFSFKKIKLIIALLLPKFILKRIKNY